MTGKIRIVRVLGNPKKKKRKAARRRKPIARRSAGKSLSWVVRALVFGPGRRLRAEYWNGKKFAAQKGNATKYRSAAEAGAAFRVAQKRLPANCGAVEVVPA